MATLSIGRASSCDIVLLHPTVSRQHAALIDVTPGVFRFVDRGSTSGSYVMTEGNWQPVRETEVGNEDRLRLGDYETSVGELLSQGEPPIPASRPAVIERDPSTGRIVVRQP